MGNGVGFGNQLSSWLMFCIMGSPNVDFGATLTIKDNVLCLLCTRRSIVCIIIIINNITNANKQDNNVNFNTMKNNDLSWEGLEMNKTLLATREHYITAPATLIHEPIKLLLL